MRRSTVTSKGQTTIHFVDCTVAASAAAEDIPIATFDADFKGFTDIRVEID